LSTEISCYLVAVKRSWTQQQLASDRTHLSII
jgi:hypothetical protein